MRPAPSTGGEPPSSREPWLLFRRGGLTFALKALDLVGIEETPALDRGEPEALFRGGTVPFSDPAGFLHLSGEEPIRFLVGVGSPKAPRTLGAEGIEGLFRPARLLDFPDAARSPENASILGFLEVPGGLGIALDPERLPAPQPPPPRDGR